MLTPVPGSRHVCADLLAQQFAYIRRYHTNWTPDDHLDALNGRRRWSRAPVVLTVDDGYKDFYQVALPQLKRFGLTAMLFVTTNFVDQRWLLWWDRLRYMLNRSCKTSLTVTLGASSMTLSLASMEERNAAWSLIADHCRFMPHERKEQLLDELAVTLELDADPDYPESDRAVTWEELKEIAGAGILVGAHTLNHPILSRLQPDEAEAEIAGSRRALEEQLGFPVHWFCYPQGGPADFSADTRRIVESLGFHGSYVAYQAMTYDAYSLPRYCITDDMLDFEWALCGAEYLVLKLRQLIGKPAGLGAAYWRGAGNAEQSKNS